MQCESSREAVITVVLASPPPQCCRQRRAGCRRRSAPRAAAEQGRFALYVAWLPIAHIWRRVDRGACWTAHSGFKWLNPAGKKFTQSTFTSISTNILSNLHNFRFRCLSFTFKTCQIVAGASMIHQFHEFLNLIFGGFLQFGPAVRQGLSYACSWHSWRSLKASSSISAASHLVALCFAAQAAALALHAPLCAHGYEKLKYVQKLSKLSKDLYPFIN